MITPSLGAVASAAGIEWVNLSALIGELGLTDPDNDPNNVAVSVSSDPTGTTVAVENSTSVDGWGEGALWVALDWADVFDDWVEDGTVAVMVHGEVITSGPDGVNYWQGIALIEATDLQEGLAVVYSRVGAEEKQGFATLTANSNMRDPQGHGGITGAFHLNDGNDIAVVSMQVSTAEFTTDTGLNAGYRLALVAGCESATDTGPHSAKVLWRAALVPTVPS